MVIARAVVPLVVVAAACGDSDVGTTDGESTDSGSTDVPTAEDTVADVATAGPDLLIDCESNIAADVPAFYADFFRCTDISVDGEFVVISGSNLPPHLSYYYGQGSDQFEEFDFSRGEEYRPNPNQIETTNFTIRIPIDPSESGNPIDARTVNLTVGDGTDYPQGPAGVALDGATYFNPLAAPGDDIEDEKFTFDSNEGHPQQMGAYHYHAVARGPLRVLVELGLVTSDLPGQAEIEIYGVMCDGTVLLGENELDGSAAGGLDVQAGHVHDIVAADDTVLLEERYHVHMAPELGTDPRGLSPEAQYYETCNVS